MCMKALYQACGPPMFPLIVQSPYVGGSHFSFLRSAIQAREQAQSYALWLSGTVRCTQGCAGRQHIL